MVEIHFKTEESNSIPPVNSGGWLERGPTSISLNALDYLISLYDGKIIS